MHADGFCLVGGATHLSRSANSGGRPVSENGRDGSISETICVLSLYIHDQIFTKYYIFENIYILRSIFTLDPTSPYTKDSIKKPLISHVQGTLSRVSFLGLGHCLATCGCTSRDWGSAVRRKPVLHTEVQKQLLLCPGRSRGSPWHYVFHDMTAVSIYQHVPVQPVQHNLVDDTGGHPWEWT